MATSRKKRNKSAAVATAAGADKQAAAPSARPQPVKSSQMQSDAEFADEYSYVRRDLRHLSLVSLVLFAIMLGIGLFI